MSPNVEPERATAQTDRRDQGSADNVLDHVRHTSRDEQLSDRSYKIRILALRVQTAERAESLAWGAGVDRVEPGELELERVGLVELERVARLVYEIDTNDLKAGPRVPDRSPATAAEQIEQPQDARPVVVVSASLAPRYASTQRRSYVAPSGCGAALVDALSERGARPSSSVTPSGQMTSYPGTLRSLSTPEGAKLLQTLRFLGSHDVPSSYPTKSPAA